MFVELIDRLRCPNEHADSWLVAAATRTAHRTLVDATLGCPVCDAEYEVRDGAVVFGTPRTHQPMPVTEDEAMRAAALLRCEERGLYLLHGGWASLTASLQGLIDVDVVLADPPPSEHATPAQGTLRGVGDRWPLAAQSLHGIALDDSSSALATDAVRTLRAAGRLVAPVDTVVPPGVRELTRDERHWVAEKLASDVVPLGRARRAE